MKSFLLDLFFPKYCINCKKLGEYVCDSCFSVISFFSNNVCPQCLKASIDGGVHPKCITHYSLDGSSSAVVYKGIIKKMVYQFKYEPFVYDLESIMKELLYEGLIQHEAFVHVLKDNPLVLAVPLSVQKLKKRGYNHAALLAEQLASQFELFFLKDGLIRIKDTKPQYTLKKDQRFTNIRGSFEVPKKLKKEIQGKTILLVDDLATTYTTLRECAKVLKRSGVQKVWGITFAREE